MREANFDYDVFRIQYMDFVLGHFDLNAII